MLTRRLPPFVEYAKSGIPANCRIRLREYLRSVYVGEGGNASKKLKQLKNSLKKYVRCAAHRCGSCLPRGSASKEACQLVPLSRVACPTVSAVILISISLFSLPSLFLSSHSEIHVMRFELCHVKCNKLQFECFTCLPTAAAPPPAPPAQLVCGVSMPTLLLSLHCADALCLCPKS